jgi:hypothetical protein
MIYAGDMAGQRDQWLGGSWGVWDIWRLFTGSPSADSTIREWHAAEACGPGRSGFLLSGGERVEAHQPIDESWLR